MNLWILFFLILLIVNSAEIVIYVPNYSYVIAE